MLKAGGLCLVCFVITLLIMFVPLQMASAQDLDALMKAKPGKARAVTSTDPDWNGNYDRIHYITPGETKVLADIEGPAVIRHIWLTFNDARPNWLEAGGSAACNEIVLRMYWDGAEEPAVEAPLSDFFGAGFGRRLELKSIPVQVEGGDGYNCYWPMPFFKRGVITATNEGDKNVRSFYYHIDYTEGDELDAQTAYFAFCHFSSICSSEASASSRPSAASASCMAWKRRMNSSLVTFRASSGSTAA